MGSPLVTVATQVKCNHSGAATSSKPSSRVKVLQQAVVLKAPPLMVASCPAKLPSPGGPVPAPCVTINMSVATVRLKVEGLAVLTESSTGTCIGPLGMMPVISPGQQRVKGI
jgi:hypothetical protein